MTDQSLTGYPSIDKPWLKYYSEEAINAPLPKMTMYQYIWENNKDYLSDIALRYYGAKITYGKLFDNIQKAARAFYAMGIRSGDIVTIMSMHTPETIFSIYALNYLGAVANMVYMTLSEKEIVETLRNTNSKLFLVLDVALKKAEAIKGEVNIPTIILSVSNSMQPHMKLGYVLKAKPKKHNFLRWQDFIKRDDGTSPPHMATDHGVSAVIVYTSGTTGEPKGVVLSNDSLNAHSFQELTAEFKFERGKTFLNVLPPFFGFGISHLHLSLNSGLDSTLWIVPKPEAVANQFFKLKPEFFVTGPAFVDAFIRHKPQQLHNLELFVGGGGALSEKEEREINAFLNQCKRGTVYANGYGMTETCSTLCCTTNELYKEGSIGIPMPKTNVKVINIDDGTELPYGEIGELCFCTPNMMIGYYHNTQATKDVILTDMQGQRWLRTGDLGIVDEDGFTYIKGRIKRIYITRDKDGTAYKLFPQRIEELLCSHDRVEKCGVIVQKDKKRMNAPLAFVTLNTCNSDQSAIIAELLRYVKMELAEYEQPISIHILDTMPMTASGKIDYRALEKEAEEK